MWRRRRKPRPACNNAMNLKQGGKIIETSGTDYERPVAEFTWPRKLQMFKPSKNPEDITRKQNIKI
jgi:hypothetical protein